MTESCTTLVFINTKSGGNQGKNVLKKILKSPGYFKPGDISKLVLVDMMRPEKPIRDIIRENMVFRGGELDAMVDQRILVCGGDGTVAWVLSEIDSLMNGHPFERIAENTRDWDINNVNIYNNLPVGIIPLGTGNDLSIVLGWGKQYDLSKRNLKTAFDKLYSAKLIDLDRWKFSYTPVLDCPEYKIKRNKLKYNHLTDQLPQDIMNNYFSVGLDAAIALDFHLQREGRLEDSIWNSRLMNKAMYGILGVNYQRKRHNKFYKHASLICDNSIDYTLLLQKYKVQGLIILNINSYAGGFSLWRDKKKNLKTAKDTLCKHGNTANELIKACLCHSAYRSASYCDGYLEVLAITKIADMTTQLIGVNNLVHLAQTKTIKLTTNKPIAMQIDGEPAFVKPTTLTINHMGTSKMLLNK